MLLPLREHRSFLQISFVIKSFVTSSDGYNILEINWNSMTLGTHRMATYSILIGRKNHFIKVQFSILFILRGFVLVFSSGCEEDLKLLILVWFVE